MQIVEQTPPWLRAPGPLHPVAAQRLLGDLAPLIPDCHRAKSLVVRLQRMIGLHRMDRTSVSPDELTAVFEELCCLGLSIDAQVDALYFSAPLEFGSLFLRKRYAASGDLVVEGDRAEEWYVDPGLMAQEALAVLDSYIWEAEATVKELEAQAYGPKEPAPEEPRPLTDRERQMLEHLEGGGYLSKNKLSELMRCSKGTVQKAADGLLELGRVVYLDGEGWARKP